MHEIEGSLLTARDLLRTLGTMLEELEDARLAPAMSQLEAARHYLDKARGKLR